MKSKNPTRNNVARPNARGGAGAVHTERVTEHINRKKWWHVPPQDRDAYRKRGKFLSSTFAEAEFWGRPLDEAQIVKVSRPLIGDEATIERKLFGRTIAHPDISMEERWSLDAKLKRAALRKGFDSIVLLSPKCFSELKKLGKIPRSIELNILDPAS